MWTVKKKSNMEIEKKKKEKCVNMNYQNYFIKVQHP